MTRAPMGALACDTITKKLMDLRPPVSTPGDRHTLIGRICACANVELAIVEGASPVKLTGI